ncbi:MULTISPECIES: SCO6745 family protein [unclassified Streptomyces]|uniref:SCO6745 family protein n=1 Tax=unclassified Streptomyces TaxID=2593676 RepID=UPI0036E61154
MPEQISEIDESVGAREAGVEPARVRQMWHLLEPLHAVLYYAPEAFEEAAALGYGTGERWPSYFPYRAAPLGRVGPEQVASAFYSFSPRMVAEHAEPAWRVASPDAVIEARTRAVDRAYRAILGDRMTGPELAEAAALARRAAESADTAARPLATANAALDWPQAPHLQLWHAATILREHRGDGHLAALLVAGLDPVESLVSFAAIGAASVERFESRGWSPEEWTAARDRLAARGLVDADGAATVAGRALRHRVERHTDQLASGPWQSLGPADADRLAELLGDFWVAVLASGLLPSETTLGIGKV